MEKLPLGYFPRGNQRWTLTQVRWWKNYVPMGLGLEIRADWKIRFFQNWLHRPQKRLFFTQRSCSNRSDLWSIPPRNMGRGPHGVKRRSKRFILGLNGLLLHPRSLLCNRLRLENIIRYRPWIGKFYRGGGWNWTVSAYRVHVSIIGHQVRTCSLLGRENFLLNYSCSR